MMESHDVKKDWLNVSVLEVLRCSHPLARSQPSDCYCIQLKSLSICCCFSPVITEEGAGDWAGGEILSYIPDQWRASYHQASCSSSIHMWPHSTSLLLFSRLFFVCFVHFHLVCSFIFSPKAGLSLQWYRESSIVLHCCQYRVLLSSNLPHVGRGAAVTDGDCR